VDAGAAATLNCLITSTILNASASTGPEFTYTWTTPDGNIVSGANTLNPEIDLPGTYVLTVVDNDNGCSSFSSVDVILDADFPTAVAAADDPLTCSVNQVDLDGTGSNVGPNFSYSWTTLDGNILSGGTTLNPTVNLTGTYTLTVLNLDNNCETTTDVMVMIDTLAPLAEAGLTDLLTCDIVELNLNGTGSSVGTDFDYQWSTTNGNIVSGDTTIDPLINEPGTYEIQVTNNSNGCSSTDLVVIDEDVDLPTAVSAVDDLLTCDLTSLFLSGTGSSVGAEFTYNWSTTNGNILSGGTTLEPEVNEPGTYTLTIEDQSNGCVSETSLVVEQDIVDPTVVIATPDLLTCVNLTVQISGNGSSTGSEFVPAWSTLNGNILSGTNTLNIEVDQAGTYTLFIENEDNGCTAETDIVVGQDIEEPVVDAGTDFLFPCDEEETSLNGSATANSNNLQIEWTSLDGTIANNASSFNANISSPGTYLLTVTNLDNGCLSEDEVQITEDNPTDPDLQVDQPLCSDDLGIIEVTNVEAGSPPYTYSIDGGATFFSNPLFPGLESGDYSIIVQDALGCESNVVNSTIVQPDPIEIITEDNIDVLQGESYQLNIQLLNISPADVDTVIWTPTTGLSCLGCLNPIATPLSTTTYTVEVITFSECRSSEEFRLVVDERPAVYVPNAFSPDNDGDNDLFYIFARDENIAQIRSFVVLSRWGETVHQFYNFQPNDPDTGWDGTFRGSAMNAGVFVWYAEIEMINGQIEIFKGDVMLVR
jgi:gliding motility-associated-like protein